MPFKYIVRHAGEVIGKRVSKERIYTHAIACWGHGQTAVIKTWCGSYQLAQRQQLKYQRYGFNAAILPVEIEGPRILAEMLPRIG